MPRFTHYHNAVRFLEGLSNIRREKDYMRDRKRSDIYLLRMRYFLRLLGNPDRGMRYVHITGTAGKGSVAAMVQRGLIASGETTGLFTSPFVTTTIEKFKVGDTYIPPDEFTDIAETIMPSLDRAYKESPYGGPTYFETILAIAFVYFKRKKCVWVVLEAMCGGRYDATNVISAPVVSAVTNVDYDHMEILGNTLSAIANDKAGIIKRGSAFFTTERRANILNIFRRACRIRGAVFNHVPTAHEEYESANRKLASAILNHIGVSERAIAWGIASTHMPARFETVQINPRVIIDGAHNPIKMRSTAKNLGTLTYKKLHLVIAVSGNKDLPSILSEIAPYADAVYATRFEITERKCAPPHELAQEIRRHARRGVRVWEFINPRQALDMALKSAKKNDLVLVTGSFFLAGALRERWYPEEWVLAHTRSM
jgi:dihydrofolate synthase/folylpolyglutamate synthase